MFHLIPSYLIPTSEPDEDATSERVAFTCSGCGRDTVIHVGVDTFLPEKRCFRCVGSLRSGRGGGPAKKGRTGTHEGRIKDKERREVKRAASARNRARRSGTVLKNGTTHRPSCASYGCTHRKHRVPEGRR